MARENENYRIKSCGWMKLCGILRVFVFSFKWSLTLKVSLCDSGRTVHGEVMCSSAARMMDCCGLTAAVSFVLVHSTNRNVILELDGSRWRASCGSRTVSCKLLGWCFSSWASHPQTFYCQAYVFIWMNISERHSRPELNHFTPQIENSLCLI